MMMIDVVAGVIALALGGVSVGMYRAAKRAERSICDQLHHDRVDRLIERAGEVRERLHEINGSAAKDKARREVEAALAASDERERERVKAADYVWRTTGSDGGESSGDAEIATVGAIASLLSLFGTWWARMLVLVLVATMLIVLLAAPQMVVVVPHDPGPHVVPIVRVSDESLVEGMRNLYRGEARRGSSPERFRWMLGNLLAVHRSPDRGLIESVRDRLVSEYEQEMNR